MKWNDVMCKACIVSLMLTSCPTLFLRLIMLCCVTLRETECYLKNIKQEQVCKLCKKNVKEIVACSTNYPPLNNLQSQQTNAKADIFYHKYCSSSAKYHSALFNCRTGERISRIDSIMHLLVA